MHILFIHQAFAAPGEAGGTRHYELLKHLEAKGHTVTVARSDVSYISGQKVTENHPSGESDSFRIIKVKTPGKLHTSYLWRLFNYLSFFANSVLSTIRMNDIDVVIGTSPPLFQGLAAYILSFLKRVPFIFEIRDLWPDFVVEAGLLKNPAVIFAAHIVERFLYKHADYLIVNSPGYIDHIVDKGISRGRIILIPNGVTTSMFDPDSKGMEIRATYGLRDKTVVMYAGAIGVANDISTLVETAEILGDIEEVSFVLVGNGNELERVKKLANEKNLRNVVFVPPCPKERIPGVLAAADITVAILKGIPMFKRTYPNKVFDYMAAAKPVVLAIDGVIREVVEAADCGIYAEAGNPEEIAAAILRLCESKELREAMGQKGRDFVKEHFDRSLQAEEFERLIVSLEENQ